MKRKKGRPKGEKKFKFLRPYLIEINLTCKYCKRIFAITTQKNKVDDVYTDEVRKKWACGVCKEGR